MDCFLVPLMSKTCRVIPFLATNLAYSVSDSSLSTRVLQRRQQPKFNKPKKPIETYTIVASFRFSIKSKPSLVGHALR